jgi:hypothetical protein
MAKPHHQQQPLRPMPTPPPAPKAEAPVITSVALGKTADGRHAVALLRTQGLAVVSCALLAPSTPDASSAEEAWRMAAYPTLYHGNPPATVSGVIVSGTGLALRKNASGKTEVMVIELEDGKMLPVRKPDATSPDPQERLGSVPFEGGKLDAWQELELYAAKYLLRESLAERRRRSAVGG